MQRPDARYHFNNLRAFNINQMKEATSTREEIIAPPLIDTCSNHAGKRILVADDEMVLLNYMARLLGHAGYQVETASDGEAAWEALNKTHFDLLITDHNMPKLKGLDLIRRLRAVSPLLPAILISGVLPRQDKEFEVLTQPGAAFEKSLEFGRLLPRVRELLNTTWYSGNAEHRIARSGLIDGQDCE